MNSDKQQDRQEEYVLGEKAVGVFIEKIKKMNVDFDMKKLHERLIGVLKMTDKELQSIQEEINTKLIEWNISKPNREEINNELSKLLKYIQKDVKGDVSSIIMKENKEKKGMFLSYIELKEEVRRAGIKTMREYQKEQKKHDNWPSNPNIKFKEDWINWNDLFGKKFLFYKELQEEVRVLGIKTSVEYIKEQKIHDDWPSSPDNKYKEEWINWSDFLEKDENDHYNTKEFLSYYDLKQVVRKAGIKSMREYIKEQKIHADWPSNPDNKYKEEWINWFDLLGKDKKDTHNKKFLSYKELQAKVKKAGIKTMREYLKEHKKHDNWPSNPDNKYKEEWINWFDLLGKDKKDTHNKKFLSYKELQAKVKKAGIKTMREYLKEQKKHNDWPSSPQTKYEGKWKAWYVFLEKDNKDAHSNKKYISYKKLQEEVKEAGINSVGKYQKEQKTHDDWPIDPFRTYKTEWSNWSDLFGSK